MDLTVFINCHNEGRLLRPTLNSVAEAMDVAINNGISSELIVIADNPSNETVAVFEAWKNQSKYEFIAELLLVSEGNPGTARNKGAEYSKAKFVAFCDGDDLVSDNYFHLGIIALKNLGERYIVHPEYLFSFGDRSGIWHIGPENHVPSYRNLLAENPWCSSSISRRETYLEVPYEDLTGTSGYGPEDWYWNVQTSLAGFKHVTAPDTSFFYRTRASGGVNNTHLNSLLPPVDIKSLATSLPHTLANQPDQERNLRTRLTHFYSHNKKRLVWFRNRFPRTSHNVYKIARKIYAQLIGLSIHELASTEILNGKPNNSFTPAILRSVQKATWHEPGISWTAYQIPNLPIHRSVDTAYTEVLESLLTQLGNKPKFVVAVPWVGVGGADLVSINYATALKGFVPQDGSQPIMLSTGLAEKTNLEFIPEGVQFIQIDEKFHYLPEQLKSRLIAQAFTISKPEMVIAVNCFDFVNSMRRYGKQIAEHTRAYFTFFAFDRIGNNYPTQPITDGSREFLEHSAGLLTDNQRIANYLIDVLGVDQDFIRVHRQPAFGNNIELEKSNSVKQNSTESQPIRLLWPHRLDKEKRPEVLPLIMRAAKSEGLNIEIDVFGQAVLGHNARQLFTEFKKYGVNYQGPYSGGLAALETENYDALLLTSESEGMPIVVLQSMMLGLPVIATDVGGIGEIVIPSVTGFLANGPEDITGFIRAIQQIRIAETREKIAYQAKAEVLKKHSWHSFSTQILELVSEKSPRSRQAKELHSNI